MTDYSALTGYQAVVEQREDFWFQRIFAAVPRLTVSEWADRHRMLSSEASATQGQWTSFPFQRPIMDACLDHRYRRVVAMLPSQVGGKTEIPLNLIGYLVDLSPGPILMVEPTLEMARALSKDRIAPMFRDTPRLQGKLRETARMESNNTLLHKAGAGWRLTLVGSNTPTALSMRPVMAVLFDEPDRYPPSAGREGDVITLGEARTASYPHRISYVGGTPTITGASRIEEEYEKSTMGKWQVPCPHCEFRQSLEWGGPDEPYGLKWETGQPDTAQYLCGQCGALIDESCKDAMNAEGSYAHMHGERDVVGFHFTALVSPMIRWARVVREWDEAQGNQERIKGFVNTKLARSYEIPGEKLDIDKLAERRESYAAEIPTGVLVVVLAVDVQPDRLECTLWGYGAGEESWIIWHRRLYGDTAKLKPSTPGEVTPWQDLEGLRTRGYQHESGSVVRIRVTCVDFGFQSAQVSDYGRPRRLAGVHLVRGTSNIGRPLIGNRPGKSNKYRVPVWQVGTDAAKDVLFPRLRRVQSPGPGYIHIPTADRVDDVYLAQWANEKAVTVIRSGRRYRTYVPVSERASVEAIDCGVYALAGLWILGPQVREGLGREPVAEQTEPKPATPSVPWTHHAPRRTNWATAWRRSR